MCTCCFYFCRTRPPPRPTLFPYTTLFRSKCTTRCARMVAKPPRSRSNRPRQGLSTAEIVSQSAGRDGSSQERQQSVRTLFRSSSQPAVRLARSSSFFLPCERRPRTNPISGGPDGPLHLEATQTCLRVPYPAPPHK